MCVYLPYKKGSSENSGSNIVMGSSRVRAGEVALWIRHLPHKQEEVSSNPQDPYGHGSTCLRSVRWRQETPVKPWGQLIWPMQRQGTKGTCLKQGGRKG